MAKKKEEKIKQNYNREVIDLKEFMLLDAKKQDEKIKETLDIMYEGNLTVSHVRIFSFSGCSKRTWVCITVFPVRQTATQAANSVRAGGQHPMR